MNQCWVPESTFVFFSWWKTVTNPLQLLVFSSKEKISHVGNQSTASKKLSWKWKAVPEPWNRPGFLASREEFNLGPEMRLDRSELLYNKVLLKYKRDRASFWHRHQKGGRKSVPLLVFSQMLYSYQQSADWRKEMSQNSKNGTRTLTHNMHFEITLAQGELSWAIKWLTWILKKGRFPSKCSLINIA